MPDIQNAPEFVQALNGQSSDDRKTTLEQVHAEYKAHSSEWSILLDAFEGAGGFLDGSYLWQYPNEYDSDYETRQKMARYHNYVDALVDLYTRFVFTQGVKRSSNNDEYNAWLEDVDGAGTPIDELLKRFASYALVNGHSALLMDKTADTPTGPAVADEQADIFATLYPATTLLDWRVTRNRLMAVKLDEATPQPSIAELQKTDESRRYLLWDEEGWGRFDLEGNLLAADSPGLGLVPLIILRPFPSIMSSLLGRALISNAKCVQALFNRASEEDEVLRRQSFSILTVETDPEKGDPEKAREALGSVLGSAKAIVVPGKIGYKTPDQETSQTIRANIEYLVQELYRSAHVRYSRDSLSAESAEAIRLQHAELNEMLQGLGKSLAAAEQEIAWTWFAWHEASPEAAEAAFEAAEVKAEYPSEFFLDELTVDLEAWGEAIAMDLGPTMTKRVKKRAVRRVDPDLSVEDLAAIDQEIDDMDDETATVPVNVAVPPEVPEA